MTGAKLVTDITIASTPYFIAKSGIALVACRNLAQNEVACADPAMRIRFVGTLSHMPFANKQE